MTREIVIDPITRIEGHSKITIYLDDSGRVKDAHFHVTQYRGFEKFCEGRPFYEMPGIMGRVCGICTVSHMLASAQACEAIMSVRAPKTGNQLRRVVNYGSILQSHALSFFHLSAPDLLMGMEADPAKRNIFGLMESHPEVARDGIALRRIGQQVIEWMAGKRLHPTWIVPGGVASPLTDEVRRRILALVPEAYAIIQRNLDWYKRIVDDYQAEARSFGNFPSMFMGLVDDEGELEFYEGWLRIVDERQRVVQEGFKPWHYEKYLGEAVEPWTFMKFPYYKPMGYPNGIYRVGPLARLNIIAACGTPKADQEWQEFRQMAGTVQLSSFQAHYARLIECLNAVERIEELLNDPDILDTRVRAYADLNQYEGVGVIEAPRGTLIHHYKADRQGLIAWANLVVATTHNNLAMNRSIQQVAHRFVDSGKLTEGMLNRVEAVIRTYDPCLSCSTHADGQLGLEIQMIGSNGELLDSAVR